MTTDSWGAGEKPARLLWGKKGCESEIYSLWERETANALSIPCRLSVAFCPTPAALTAHTAAGPWLWSPRSCSRAWKQRWPLPFREGCVGVPGLHAVASVGLRASLLCAWLRQTWHGLAPRGSIPRRPCLACPQLRPPRPAHLLHSPVCSAPRYPHIFVLVRICSCSISCWKCPPSFPSPILSAQSEIPRGNLPFGSRR